MIEFRCTKSWFGLSLVFLAGALVFSASVLRAAQQQSLPDDHRAARAKLDEGVRAYKSGQFDDAIDDFKQAAELDHSLVSARLYLATAYASQYIPGDLSDENVDLGQQALREYRSVLERNPNDLGAIDGISQLLFYMGTSPYDQDKLGESKAYYLTHIKIHPEDSEPYYWVGVIDWMSAYRSDQQLRADWQTRTGAQLPLSEPLPEVLRNQLRNETQDRVDEGIKDLKRAMELRPDYDDAMAYLSLMYRQKALIEADANARDEDNKTADELVHKVQVIKEDRMKQHPQP